MGGAASGMTVNGFIYHLPEKILHSELYMFEYLFDAIGRF